MNKEVPKEITKQLKNWSRQAAIFRTVHLLLGIVAIMASVTVASRVVPAESFTMTMIAWLAAITAGILTSMNLETKSNNFRRAWRLLNAAVLRYQTEDDFTIKDLNADYKTGEDIIGDVKISLAK